MRLMIVPDPQVRKDVPTHHIRWAVQAALEYKPDGIVVLGDWWDMPSCSMHDQAGSAKTRSHDLDADFDCGNEAFEMFAKPLRKLKGMTTRKPTTKDFLFGNHENRAARAAERDPKHAGTYAEHRFNTQDFRRHKFLENVWREGICFAHYFQNINSSYAIGGSIDNRLNRVGDSFVQGHEQGLKYGNRVFPTGRTRHGLVAGSFYLHDEDYKGRQGNTHWRGLVILNNVKNGDYDIMPLQMDYLCRKYENMELPAFLKKNVKNATELYSLARRQR